MSDTSEIIVADFKTQGQPGQWTRQKDQVGSGEFKTQKAHFHIILKRRWEDNVKAALNFRKLYPFKSVTLKIKLNQDQNQCSLLGQECIRKGNGVYSTQRDNIATRQNTSVSNNPIVFNIGQVTTSSAKSSQQYFILFSCETAILLQWHKLSCFILYSSITIQHPFINPSGTLIGR